MVWMSTRSVTMYVGRAMEWVKRVHTSFLTFISAAHIIITAICIGVVSPPSSNDAVVRQASPLVFDQQVWQEGKMKHEKRSERNNRKLPDKTRQIPVSMATSSRKIWRHCRDGCVGETNDRKCGTILNWQCVCVCVSLFCENIELFHKWDQSLLRWLIAHQSSESLTLHILLSQAKSPKPSCCVCHRSPPCESPLEKHISFLLNSKSFALLGIFKLKKSSILCRTTAVSV